MQITNHPLSEIKPYPENAKKHPEEQIDKIAKSIKKYGFNQPLVVDKEFVIIVGHGRYFAAQKLELTEVPIYQVDLSEKKAREYRLMDNKTNESGWDFDKLAAELADLPEIKLDFPELDFGEDPENQLKKLPTGPKGVLEGVQFILHEKQAVVVREAVRIAQKDGPFEEYAGMNENKNGNAIARVCEFFIANHGE